MRIIAGLLLVVTLAIHILLGVGSLLSAEYEKFKARTDAEDLASVAGDLVDEETLARERAMANQRIDTSAATLKTVFGIALLAVAAAQLLAAVLLFAGRGRRIVIGLVALSILTTVVVMSLSDFSSLGIIAVGVLIVSLVLTLLTRPRPQTA